MKPAFEQTPQRQWESFHCEVVQGQTYNATWHFHPEYQLSFVLKSRSGYRLVGDNITPLQAGDMALVGPNLPHVWHEDDTGDASDPGVHAILVRFLDTCFGEGFLQIPEMEAVLRLFKRASRGLHVTGGTRDAIAAELEGLCASRGLARVVRLLSILDQLAQSTELKPIASADFVPTLSSDDQGRVERVIAFIHAHLAEPIDRASVAAAAHMSSGAFSRFFKLRLGKTLPEYVNELRVGRACRLLANEDIKVIDLALNCGFRNLAHFNRCFRAATQLTPRDYRRQLQRCAP